MKHAIEIPSHIYDELAKLATGFDTPANVIERLLRERADRPTTIVDMPADTLKPDDTLSDEPNSVATGGRLQNVKITPEMVAEVCRLGDEIENRNISRSKAHKILVNMGMSAGSAHIYLVIYGEMLAGKAFKRTMKFADFEYILTHIKENYDDRIFQGAVRATKEHIIYFEEKQLGAGPRAERLAAFLEEINSASSRWWMRSPDKK